MRQLLSVPPLRNWLCFVKFPLLLSLMYWVDTVPARASSFATVMQV